MRTRISRRCCPASAWWEMNRPEFSHISVLLNEVLEGMNIQPGGIYVDGTAGGGGHSEAIAKRLSTGRLIALDRDPDAVRAAGERLKPYPAAQVLQYRFSQVRQALESIKISEIDGMLLDLGVSSHQLDTPERGFSYHTEDAALDMRMSQQGMTAAQLVNTVTLDELSDIISRYGEEKFAYRIARAILREREKAPIETTGRLTEIILSAMPAAARRDKHPARRTFQALRIAVNSELDELKDGLTAGFELLKPGGRLAVITFHSLEDRIVKQAFAQWVKSCTCPPDFPVCVCGGQARGRLITRKPVEAGEGELQINPRSRSAKLRIIEKII